MTTHRFLSLLAALVLTAGCEAATGNADAVNVRGSWNFTGTQASPSLNLVGVLSITAQSGQDIAGTATWDETGAGAGVVVQGGALSGRAIGDADVDFDVSLSSGTRRFVGRVSVDTIEGVWVQSSAGTNGAFRAVRSTAP